MPSPPTAPLYNRNQPGRSASPLLPHMQQATMALCLASVTIPRYVKGMGQEGASLKQPADGPHHPAGVTAMHMEPFHSLVSLLSSDASDAVSPGVIRAITYKPSSYATTKKHVARLLVAGPPHLPACTPALPAQSAAEFGVCPQQRLLCNLFYPIRAFAKCHHLSTIPGPKSAR